MKTGLIFLTGFMGAGKTSIGVQLAQQMKVPFIDMDREIETTCGSSISNIFKEKGEEYFRKQEELCLEKIIQNNENAVIATGGGVIKSEKNRSLMKKNGLTVFLDVSLENIIRRIGHTTHRPLLKASNLATIYKERRPLYMQCDLVIYTEQFQNAARGAEYLEKALHKKMKNSADEF